MITPISKVLQMLSSGPGENRSEFTDVFMACNIRCKRPCADYWSYDFSVSANTHLTDMTVRNIARLMTPSSGNGSAGGDVDKMVEATIRQMISVQIFFDSADVTVVQTSETTPILTFIANIGGQLGKSAPVLFPLLEIL